MSIHHGPVRPKPRGRHSSKTLAEPKAGMLEVTNYTTSQWTLDTQQLGGYFCAGDLYHVQPWAMPTGMLGDKNTLMMFLRFGSESNKHTRKVERMMSPGDQGAYQVDWLPLEFLHKDEVYKTAVALRVSLVARPTMWSRGQPFPSAKDYWSIAPSAFRQSYLRKAVDTSDTRYSYELNMKFQRHDGREWF